MEFRERIIFLAFVIAVSASLCFIVGCSSGNGADENPSQDNSQSIDTEKSSESEVKDDNKKNYSGLTFQDIYGDEYSDIFKGNKLTVVNLFATWCSPCVRELPELQKLSENVKEKGVGVIGIVTDAYVNDEIQKDTVSVTKDLVANANVTYPILIPDKTYFNGYILQMTSFPQTLFIDRDGNVVYFVEGSNDYNTWKQYVDSALKKLGE